MVKTIKSSMSQARKKMLEQIKNKEESEVKRKKTTKEKYKELRESIKGPEPTPQSFSDKFEEELKKQLQEMLGDQKEDTTEQFEYTATDFYKKRDGLWDVAVTEDVLYFDPELSYELTGYRPINETQGLDFDPTPFNELAQIYDRTGSYTEYPADSKPYNDFWREQYKRCTEGYTVGKYRITGDHYFFLNFYRMEVISEGARGGAGRNEKFPTFLAKQYEFFHYVEMAERLHKDVAILKTRGIGLSEIVACLAVRPYITNRGYRSLLTCAAEGKLTPLKTKCWKQLNWLDMNTNGGMRHLRQKVNNADTKRASQVTPDGVEYGWMSEIDSVIADTSDKIRGDRVDRLIYEEAGSNKYLTKSWIQGNALVELGGYHFGTRIALGTGGDDMALEGLSNIFAKPEGYNVLPYKNYDTEDRKPQLTAFFIPAHKFSLREEFLDTRGVTQSEEFKKFYEEERKKLSGKDLLDYCAEHCFIPNEALYKQGENIFDSIAIADRLTQIRIFKAGLKPEYVSLLWDRSGDTPDLTKVKVINNPNSKIAIYERPLRDEDGLVLKNLYVAGIDSIDQGSGDSSTSTDVSDFCIVIKKRIYGLQEAKYVAIYKDRPRDIREAYDVAMKLLVWYNCKALLEHTKISIVTYFKEKKKDSLFMKRPASTLGDMKRGNSQMIGVPATEAIIKHGLELINNFVNDYCYSIDIDEMLEQLLKYSWENKRKFDIIASMEMAEIADEELMNIRPAAQDKLAKEWENIGWFTNEKGYKEYGVIPQKNGTRW